MHDFVVPTVPVAIAEAKCPSARCTCLPCRQEQKQARNRSRSIGPGVVPVGTVVPALDRLAQLEIGWNAIAMASGVSVSTLRRILEGRTRSVRRGSANRILGFAAQDFDREVAGWATIERLRSLVALGHSESTLQARFGPPRPTVTYRRMLQVLNAVLTASPGPDRIAAARAQGAGWRTPDEIGPIIYDPEWDGSHVRRSV